MRTFLATTLALALFTAGALAQNPPRTRILQKDTTRQDTAAAVRSKGTAAGKAAPVSAPKPTVDLDFRNSFRVYESDALGTTELQFDHAVFDPRDELRIVFDASKLANFLPQYSEIIRDEGGEVPPTNQLAASAIKWLKYEIILWGPRSAADERDSIYKRLRPSIQTDKAGNVLVASFVPEDLFAGRKGGFPPDAQLVLEVSRDSASIPFRKVFFPSSSMLDRIRIATDSATIRGARSIRELSRVNYVDVNKPIDVFVDGNIRVVKEVKQDDGTWAKVELKPSSAPAGKEFLDTELKAGHTYRYRFVRPYLSESGSVEELDVVPSPPEFVVDEYGWFVFVPVSNVTLSNKIALPLVVPLVNRPQTSGAAIQFGPGLSFPILHINPAPKGSTVRGVGYVRPKLGFTMAALRAENADKKEEYAGYTGGWISFFDLMQFGVSWQLKGEVRGKPMWYMGFSLAEVAKLMQ